MSLPPTVRIELLADQPALIPAIGQLRYDEWAEPSQTDLAGWVAITAREVGRTALSNAERRTRSAERILGIRPQRDNKQR